MKPNSTFLRLLPGALVLTNLHSLKGETEQAFLLKAGEAHEAKELVPLIGKLPDQRSDAAAPLNFGATELLLQGGRVSINLKNVGEGCDVTVRLRTPGQTGASAAECKLEFDESCTLNGFTTPKALDAFTTSAKKEGRVLDAEAVVQWLAEFTIRPDESRQPIRRRTLAGVQA